MWDAKAGWTVRTLEGHTGTVWSVAFSPDGKWIVSGSDDLTVRVWKAQDGSLVQTFKGHTDELQSAAFSPDGKQIVAASWDKTARLWNAQDGSLFRTLEGHKDQVMNAKRGFHKRNIIRWYASDGRRLADAAPSAADPGSAQVDVQGGLHAALFDVGDTAAGLTCDGGGDSRGR